MVKILLTLFTGCFFVVLGSVLIVAELLSYSVISTEPGFGELLGSIGLVVGLLWMSFGAICIFVALFNRKKPILDENL